MTDQMPQPIDPDSCLPESVPGWLNEDGLPTGCVGDSPLVEPLPERTVSPEPIPVLPPAPLDGEIGVPVTVYPQAPRELAETGPVDPLQIVVFVIIVVVAGIGTIVTRWNGRDY